MAEGKRARGFMGPLVILNFVMFIIVLGLAGWLLDKFIDWETRHHYRGNSVPGYFLIFSLMTGAVGGCTTLAGFVHWKAWRSESLAAAISSALISWSITVISFGLACKQFTFPNRGKKLKTLEAFIIILTFTQLIYLFLLYAGIISSKFGPGFHAYDTDYAMMTKEERERKSTGSINA
ncbi:hypothetical protein LUZ60_000197 [Juncus effusus]|nr:hypothetical protein LUZ60_000197 [Juncus effusus]